jgi:DNA-binding response OmpR family regulator
MPGPYRALVVEDDPTSLEAVVAALEEEGFRCHSANDGQDAASAVEGRKFDVVITDLKMPRRNGHAFAVDLAGRGPPHPFVVVLTGIIEPRLVRDLIIRGVDDVLFKPADLDLLAVKLRALCDRREQASKKVPASHTS